MKKSSQSVLIITMALAFSTACLAEIPHQVGGFELGGQIEDVKDRLLMETAMPLRYTKFLEEIETRNTPGFKNGLIWVGKCASPGRIVRIRLKYADASKDFYNELLKRYRERFGKPAEWRGDPFHIVISWKWSFVDKQNNRISMILEHNTRDEEETLGNTVKLTMWNLIDEERKCAKEEKDAAPSESKKSPIKQADWEDLLPR